MNSFRRMTSLRRNRNRPAFRTPLGRGAEVVAALFAAMLRTAMLPPKKPNELSEGVCGGHQHDASHWEVIIPLDKRARLVSAV